MSGAPARIRLPASVCCPSSATPSSRRPAPRAASRQTALPPSARRSPPACFRPAATTRSLSPRPAPAWRHMPSASTPPATNRRANAGDGLPLVRGSAGRPCLFLSQSGGYGFVSSTTCTGTPGGRNSHDAPCRPAPNGASALPLREATPPRTVSLSNHLYSPEFPLWRFFLL